MREKRITPYILKNIIFSLLFLVMILGAINSYVIYLTNKYEVISEDFHNFADLYQLSLTYISKKRNGQKLNPIDLEVLEWSSRDFITKLRKDIEGVQEFKNQKLLIEKMNLLITITKRLNTEDESSLEALSDEVENNYIWVLTENSKILEKKKHNLKWNLIYMSIATFFLLIWFFLFLGKRLKQAMEPLTVITRFSKSFSLNEDDLEIEINKDFYEYKILTQALSEMHRRILHENRIVSNNVANDSVGNIAENIAHTVNNSLALIITSLKLFIKRYKKGGVDDVQLAVTEILSQTEDLARTTKEIKNIIHDDGKDENRLFFAHVIETQINMHFLSSFFKKQINCEINIEKDFKIFAKERIVCSIVQVLVENAVMYNDAESPRIWVNVYKQNECVIIDVADNGSLPSRQTVCDFFIEKKENVNSIGLYSSAILASENNMNLEFVVENETKIFRLKIFSVGGKSGL